MMAAAAVLLPNKKGKVYATADLCLILGMLFAFATLVVKIIEVSRKG